MRFNSDKNRVLIVCKCKIKLIISTPLVFENRSGGCTFNVKTMHIKL